MSVFIFHQIDPLWAKAFIEITSCLGSLEAWKCFEAFIPFTSLSLHPWEGSRAPAGTLGVTSTGFTSVSFFLFFLSLSTRFQSVDQRHQGSLQNPLRDHSHCKPIVCPVGSETHTNRVHNHALLPCHNTLDWFIIVQLALTRKHCLQKHFHIRPYARIDCYSPLTDKLLLHARPLFNAVLR